MKPYYQDDFCAIYHGDCLELLSDMAQVDLVVTDPPYFLPVQTYVARRGGTHRRNLGDLSVLSSFFRQIWEQLDAMLAATGTAYMFCDAKSYPIIWREMFPFFKHVRLCVWDKLVSYNGYTWRHQHELIAWGERESAIRVPTGDGDILKERGVRQKDKQHPAQKPVPLLARLLGKHDSDLILDPFMGSGSTLCAAKSLKLKAVGIEIEEKYCEIAARRCSQEVLW